MFETTTSRNWKWTNGKNKVLIQESDIYTSADLF